MALKDLFRKKKAGRACVVGLDGVPYTLVQKFCADGTWPFMAGLVKAGSLAQMHVTLPEISAVSWPSFMTGVNPGVHGVFGFIELNPDYSMRFTNFASLKTNTFWDRLGAKGKKSIVINQPGTYPAREIPGVLISGFVAVELNQAVKPLRYLATLRRANYEIDIDTQRCRKDHDQLFRELDQTLAGRRAVAETLWKGEDWDYFQVVITGTDRLQHYIFPSIEDPAHPRHAQAIAYYRKIDGFIREMWERHHADVSVSREGEGFFLLSDHGFCTIQQEVYVNTWLREQGYLAFEKFPPESMADISAESRAFCLDPGRIYLHRAGKHPKGRVKPEDEAALLAELKTKLLGLRFGEQKVMEAVKLQSEAYQGPEAKNGPDLVCVPHHGFDLKGRIAAEQVFGRSDLTGMHTWDDAFFWSLDPVNPDLEITQLAEIVTKKIVANSG
jgi:predicted AlkP superfamily phosphohydrolase/phosphomutase